MADTSLTKGKITGIISNLVTIEVDGPVSQNEICFIMLGNEKLMAEVIKIVGNIALPRNCASTAQRWTAA